MHSYFFHSKLTCGIAVGRVRLIFPLWFRDASLVCRYYELVYLYMV